MLLSHLYSSMKKKNSIKKTKNDIILEVLFYIFISLFSLICLYPFYQVLISSFTDENTLVREGYKLFPSKLSLDAYRTIFSNNVIPRAYLVTIFITVVGTLLALIVTGLAAYALSGKKLKYRGGISLFFYFTCLFSGGLVAYYLLITNYLHLDNSIWVYIIPAMFNVWNMFLLRNFFNEIPISLIESAKMDGANEIVIAFKIVLPLSLPALATIGLFTALGFWNEWMASSLYIDDEKLYTLQYIIVRMVNSISAAQNVGQAGLPPGVISVPANTIRLATAMVTVGPIILLYPFLQKYFVKGLRVGGVKE